MSMEANEDTQRTQTIWPARPVADSFSAHVKVDLAGLSHAGKVRSRNEDHFVIGRADRSLSVLMTNLAPRHVPKDYRETAYGMVVADGLGGRAAGEVASQVALTTLLELILQTPDWMMRGTASALEAVKERQYERFQEINRALLEQVRQDPRLAGMATTLTLIFSLGSELLVAHVGDSRAYLFRHGRLQRLTCDHTYVQQQIDAGIIKPADAANHPMGHYLTRALGGNAQPVKTELLNLLLADGDRILLCTDGLTKMVPDAVIAEVLAGPGPATSDCQRLVELALEGGGKDNVTVAVARYGIPRKKAE